MGCRRQVFMAATAKAEWPRTPRATTVGRVALLIVLGALLAGCDKCGDWWWSPMRGAAQGETQVCREQAPKPQ